MAGISKIKDILLPTEKLNPCNFFIERGLNLNNYLVIVGLSKALPESWRALLNWETRCCLQIPDSQKRNINFYRVVAIFWQAQ